MKAFVALFNELDRTTSLNEKQAALTHYFQSVPAADGAWTVALLSGRRPKKPMSSREIKDAVLDYLKAPEWMLTESYEAVGDLGETIALLIDTLRIEPPREDDNVALAVWLEERLPSLKMLDERARRDQLQSWWAGMKARDIFVLQKLIGGGFRVGASETIVIKALAAAAQLPIAVITQRLTGKWVPNAAFYQALLASADDHTLHDPAQPFPFALAYPLDAEPETLGERSEWGAEWKWDGIRAQIVRRGGDCHIWSRGEELITGAFPEIKQAAMLMLEEGTVLDGELLVFDGDKPATFGALQKRLGRKKVSPATMAAAPVRFLAYDILEREGEDLRSLPFGERRDALEKVVEQCDLPLGFSPLVRADDWGGLKAEREEARARGVEGLMLKNLSAPYRSGRRKGDWWKWKVEPYAIDAVLLYAQAGSGRRANLFTDYSFAVWDQGRLVPIAKAYSGLDQQEIAELDKWIRGHTQEKFGPVRSVEPVHVFELGFEGIQESKRHKAGVALRFPRILRWRRDKPANEADDLDSLKALLHAPA